MGVVLDYYSTPDRKKAFRGSKTKAVTVDS
jgi:hypothetical protein